MKKLGLITIGQAPRTDIMEELTPIFQDSFEVLQRGALDGVTETELESLKPAPGETVLASCLADGTAVVMAEERILDRLQDCIDALEAEGVSFILFLCTGDFRNRLTSTVPCIYPNRILAGLIPALCRNKRLAVLVPEEDQKEEAQRQWKDSGITAEVIAISPYEGSADRFKAAASEIEKTDAECVLMDCMGYSKAMRLQVTGNCSKPVVLPRTAVAAILKELFI